MSKRWIAIWGLLSLICGTGINPVFAEDTQVTREILIILHEKGDISDETYRAMIGKLEKKDQEKIALNAFWNNGMRLESDDKAFKISLGGRILNDWGLVNADKAIEDAFTGQTLQGTGTEMRHARFYMAGTIYDQFTFKADYDFAGTDVDFKDVWIGMKNIPLLGEFRVGHQKEPFSLETMNSLPNTVFMERGLPVAFVPVRNTGVKVHQSLSGERIGWGIGIYKDVDTSDGFDDGSDYNITGRLTWAPYMKEDKTGLLHLGVSYSHQFRDEDRTMKYRSRPETNLITVYTVDTGSIKNVSGVDLIGPEVAFASGPFCFQSEYVHSWLNRTSSDDLDFKGYYLFCSFFLTGEHRPYRMDEAGGEFSRVIPNRPFDLKAGGWGAWQVAVRYSAIDLNDGDVDGGREENYTIGINWFMNPNLRITFNYVLADIDERIISANETPFVVDDDSVEIYMMRFQVDF